MRTHPLGILAIATAVLVVPAANTMSAARQPLAGSWARADQGTAIDANTGRPIPCRCRHGGRLYEVGQTACLSLPEGRRLARCDRFQNVTTWTPIGEGCDDLSSL